MFEREVPLFKEIPEFPSNIMRITSVPKPAMHSTVSIGLRSMRDGQTQHIGLPR